MGAGRDYTRHQKGIINRYYEHRETIATGRLSELVSELYLASSDAQRERLWKRVEQALSAAQADPKRAAGVLRSRDVKALAALVGDIDAGRGIKPRES